VDRDPRGDGISAAADDRPHWSGRAPQAASIAELNGMIVNVELLDYENQTGRR